MTRIPSRNMPKYSQYTVVQPMQPITPFFIDFILISIAIALGVYLLWCSPILVLIVTSILVYIYSFQLIDNEEMQRLASKRPNEDIGTFARSLDYRNIDTWVIRAVHEAFSEWFLTYKYGIFPLRASDKIGDSWLLPMDDFDFEDVTEIILKRTSRTEENLEENPYYDKLYTVKDYIYFINAQPKLT